MRWRIKNILLIPSVIAGLGLVFSGQMTAQVFTSLHSFNFDDGASPKSSLVLAGNTLYGTAYQGGSAGYGTIFAINTDGSGFTNTSLVDYASGANPFAGLMLSGNTLYGTTYRGGSLDNGAIFAFNPDGMVFTNLHSLVRSTEGRHPEAGLILSGDTLYGTTIAGGSLGYGTIFSINANGTSFTNLHTFDYDAGANPESGLVLSGGVLYGTTYQGGGSGYGVVFAMNTDGTGYTNLHDFNSGEGANPLAGLILSGNVLYGTTEAGGNSGFGTVFAMNIDGTGFTNLHHFTGGSNGRYPKAGLVLSGNTLYGTAYQGGSSGYGTIFAVSVFGTGFTNLYSFSDSDGASPYAGLILSDGTLYGTTEGGGSFDSGTVFSLELVPKLKLALVNTNAILTWSTNFAGFTLQSTTNLASPVWGSVAPGPVVVNGQNAVTNPISGKQKFYRLSQ